MKHRNIKASIGYFRRNNQDQETRRLWKHRCTLVFCLTVNEWSPSLLQFSRCFTFSVGCLHIFGVLSQSAHLKLDRHENWPFPPLFLADWSTEVNKTTCLMTQITNTDFRIYVCACVLNAQELLPLGRLPVADDCPYFFNTQSTKIENSILFPGLENVFVFLRLFPDFHTPLRTLSLVCDS